jgi:hypothetical protein
MENILAVNNLGQLNLDGQKYVNQPGTGITTNYIVYFKYNSLIALRGIQERAYFSVQNNIAWIPAEFNLSSIISWNSIPYSAGFSAVPDPVEGLGDPCELAAKDNVVTGDWCVPTSAELWSYYVGAPSGSYSNDSDYYVYESVGAASPYPDYNIAHFPQTGQSLPVAGYYMANGEMNYGGVEYGGLYMANVNNNHLTIDPTRVWSTYLSTEAAFSIRCFPKSGSPDRRSLAPPPSDTNGRPVAGATGAPSGR